MAVVHGANRSPPRREGSRRIGQRKELKALAGTVAARFADDIGCAGAGDFCYAH